MAAGIFLNWTFCLESPLAIDVQISLLLTYSVSVVMCQFIII